MKVKEKYYHLLKSGHKTIELRLFDEKRQQIRVGDILCFSNADDPSDSFKARVTALYRGSDFRDLCHRILPISAGFSNEEELIREMQKFYSSEQQKTYGVIGIEIKICLEP